MLTNVIFFINPFYFIFSQFSSYFQVCFPVLTIEIDIQNLNSMSLSRRFFAEFDLFAAPPLLRARKEPQTSSYTSGILSFVTALFFVYVFINGIIEVLTYDKINTVQTDTKLSGDEVKGQNIFFAVRVGYLDIQDSLKLFQIGVFAKNSDGQNITVPLQSCRSQSWSSIGKQYQKQFRLYLLQKFFCPKETENLNIQKVYYNPQTVYINVYVKPCSANIQCEQNETIRNQKIKEIQDREGSIFLTLYFKDNLISPAEKQPISVTINTDVEFSFTMKRGIIGTIQLGTFKISTDVGYFPISQQQFIDGNFINSFRQTSFQVVNQTQNYAFIYITMGRRYIYIDRTVGKFDQMLSYAGGLFAIIAGFLKFFMFSYNQYRYELMVAEGVCNNDENGNLIRQSELTFLKYIKYTAFDWIKVLFCHEIDWKQCKLIDEARQQASSHLDVTNLFRKINSFERALQHLLSQNEKQCLALLKPQSLNKTRRDRLILQYYSSIIKGQSATTIQQYKTAQSLLNFSLRLFQKSLKTNRVINQDAEIPPQFQKSQYSVRKSQSTQEILELFPDLIHTAAEIQLPPDMNEIQNELCDAFYNLSPEKRAKLESNIPIKLLIRMKLKHEKLLQQQQQQSASNSCESNVASYRNK